MSAMLLSDDAPLRSPKSNSRATNLLPPDVATMRRLSTRGCRPAAQAVYPMSDGMKLKEVRPLATEKEAHPGVPGWVHALTVDEHGTNVGNPWPVAAQPAGTDGFPKSTHVGFPEVISPKFPGQQYAPEVLPPTHAASPAEQAGKSPRTTIMGAIVRARASDTAKKSEVANVMVASSRWKLGQRKRTAERGMISRP